MKLFFYSELTRVGPFKERVVKALLQPLYSAVLLNEKFSQRKALKS
jgi:hypothetical protein